MPPLTSRPSNPELVQLAIDHLSAGNFVVADLLARDVLDSEPDNPDALNIVGIVAAQIGLPDKAVELFRRVLTIEPGFAPAENNIRRALNRAPLPPSRAIDGCRYLLIKAWGYGFWSDVSHVLGGLLLADVTGRIPVVHWGRNSLFGDGTDRDAFRDHFEPIGSQTIESLLAVKGADFFPAKWSAAKLRLEDLSKWSGPDSVVGAIRFLARPETIAVADFYLSIAHLLPWLPETHRLSGKAIEEAYRDLAGRYLKPRPEIAAQAETFFREHLDGAPSVAVHYRGTDKHGELDNLDEVNRGYFDVLDGLPSEMRVFLLTEDAAAVERFRARYGNRIVTTDAQRTSGDTGVHYLPSSDRKSLGIEVMVDTYVALRCDRFIGNGASNVSAFVATLKTWREGDCILLAPSLLSFRAPAMFTPRVGL
jgi:protein O-GlcNAc transferase